MTNTINSQTIVTETKKYFSNVIKSIYFNMLKPNQWMKYFNILKASLETNTPITDILTFAEALDYARVTLIFNSDAEQQNYNKMREELKSIIKRLKEPKILEENKKMVLVPRIVPPTIKEYNIKKKVN